MSKILIIEPFYGGSHKSMVDTLVSGLSPDEYTLITMTAKKWHWRARCGALYILQMLPSLEEYYALFCSSVLSLSELVGLSPGLTKLKKIIYFHENQLVYPVQNIKNRDYQYGYNQVTSCLAADVVVFNSNFNKNSFLNSVKKFIKIQPDFRPKNISEMIEPKSMVLYYPLNFQTIDALKVSPRRGNKVLHIVWPHRWEFDKNPDLFFNTLLHLKENDIDFCVSVFGESFSEVPSSFQTAQTLLESRIKHYGYAESVENFYKTLWEADVIVSTAQHEFFGVAMLEGVRCGCVPLAPNALVYPEFYPSECLYETPADFLSKLKQWCLNPGIVEDIRQNLKIDTDKFSSVNLLPKYMSLLKNR